jgi:hypothetical protein
MLRHRAPLSAAMRSSLTEHAAEIGGHGGQTLYLPLFAVSVVNLAAYMHVVYHLFSA